MADADKAKQARLKAAIAHATPVVRRTLAYAAGAFAPFAWAMRAEDEDRAFGLGEADLRTLWRWLDEGAAQGEAGALVEAGATLAAGLPISDLAKRRTAFFKASAAATAAPTAPDGADVFGRIAAMAPDLDRLGLSDQSKPPGEAALREHVNGFVTTTRKRDPQAGRLALAIILRACTASGDAGPMLAHLFDTKTLMSADERAECCEFAVRAALASTLVFEGGPDVSALDALEAAKARFEAVNAVLNPVRARLDDSALERVYAQSGSAGAIFAGVAQQCARAIDLATGPQAGEEPADAPAAASAFLVGVEPMARLLGFAGARSAAVRTAHAALSANRLDQVLRTLAGCDDLKTRGEALQIAIQSLVGEHEANAFARRVRAATGEPDLAARVFAFMDPLIDSEADAKTPGRILRASTEAVWDWALQDLAAERLEALEAELKDCRADQIDALVIQARVAVSDALRDALADVDDHMVRTRIGKRGLADVHEIATLLAVSPLLSEVSADWPSVLPNLSGRIAEQVIALYDRVTTRTPEAGPLVLQWVAARLRRPTHILRIVSRILGHESDVSLQGSPLAAVYDSLIARIEREAVTVARTLTARPFCAQPAALATAMFAELALGVTEEISVRKDGPWGKRLFAARGSVAKAMERAWETTVEAVDAAAPLRPEDSAASDGGDAFADALERIVFIGEVTHWARRVGVGASRDRARDAVAQHLDRAVEARLYQGFATPEAALEALEPMAQLMGALDGPNASQLVRRRAVAAAA